MEYTIIITEEEQLSLENIMYDVEDWTLNVVKERARLAGNDIVNLTVQKCLDEGIQIPSTRLDIIKLAYEQNWIINAKNATDAVIANPPVG